MAARIRSSPSRSRKFGIDATFVDPDDPENFRRALQPNTNALYAETIGNPQINVLDIERSRGDRARSAAFRW